MIFETLSAAADRRELILTVGGLCHWHLRRDGQITIREILVLPQHRNLGVGSHMLTVLKNVNGVTTGTTANYARAPRAARAPTNAVNCFCLRRTKMITVDLAITIFIIGCCVVLIGAAVADWFWSEV